MHKHRCPRLTGLALINGLGLGLFLAAHREIEENNAISWEAVVDPPICNLNTDVTMPLLFLIIPLITTIGVWFVASKLFAALPHLSKFSLWSWVLVGMASLLIMLPLMYGTSTDRSLSQVGVFSEFIRVCSVVLFYEVWFGLILVFARQWA